MSRKGVSKPSTGDLVIQVPVRRLIVFGLCVVFAAGVIAYGLIQFGTKSPKNSKPDGSISDRSAENSGMDAAPEHLPPWGELIIHDIDLEQPEEYIGYELQTRRAPAWVFNGMTPEMVRGVLAGSGLSSNQIDVAMAPSSLSTSDAGTVLHPDDTFLFALSAGVRGKLYAVLAKDDANHYMRFPFIYPQKSFEARVAGANVEDQVVSMVRKLLYIRGDSQCFSDYELVLQHLPSESEKMHLVKVLSRQSAVLARLRIRPDTDTDKLLGYWRHGVQAKDLKPLLESIKRLPDGGTLSLLYLLPPLARERLYTYPEPSQPGDPPIDCHWTSLNFFNEKPDNRFGDPAYAANYLTSNYARVSRPEHFGDIVMLADEKGSGIHSGVYIADDLIFTKNGNNYAQPWKIIHLKDLLDMYGIEDTRRLSVYRNKDW